MQKDILKVTIYGHGGHWSCDLDCLNIFPLTLPLEALNENLVTTGQVSFEVTVLGQRSKNDLDLLYLQIKTTEYINFPAKIFKTFLEILCISIFPYFTVLKKRSRPTQGHYLNII